MNRWQKQLADLLIAGISKTYQPIYSHLPRTPGRRFENVLSVDYKFLTLTTN